MSGLVVRFVLLFFFFFFQAEDGIRDLIVTGVQTCALPISIPSLDAASPSTRRWPPPKFPTIRIGFAIASPLSMLQGMPIPATAALAASIQIGRASCRERV